MNSRKLKIRIARTIRFHGADTDVLRAALEALPLEFREALVLRELEGFSYKEIAEVADVPVGTVMSRLARARRQLQNICARKETHELR